MSTVELAPLEERIINHYLGWQEHWKAYNGNNPHGHKSFLKVVDSNLLPVGTGKPAEYTSIDQIRGETEELYAAVDGNVRDPEYVKRKLEASVTFARVLDKNDVGFAEYFEASTGVAPEMVTDPAVTVARDEVVRLLDEQGIEFSHKGGKDFWRRFSVDSADIREVFEIERLRSLPLLQKHVAYEPEDTVVTVEPVDANWVAYLDFDPMTGFNTRINSDTSKNPQHEGRVASLAHHEFLGHATQFSMWRNGILTGEISPVAGLIMTHSPEVTHFEGIAHLAMQRFLPDGPWPHRYEAAYDRLRLIAAHNGHLAINDGMELQEAADMTSELLPFEPREKIDGMLQEAVGDVMWKTYGACYYPGYKLLAPLVAATDDKLKAVLPEVYSRPLLPDQIATLAAA